MVLKITAVSHTAKHKCLPGEVSIYYSKVQSQTVAEEVRFCNCYQHFWKQLHIHIQAYYLYLLPGIYRAVAYIKK